MTKDRKLKLDEVGIKAAAAALLNMRGFGYAETPEEGQDAYDITTEAIEEARNAVASYILSPAPLPEGAENLLERLDDLVFSGRLGDWRENADLLLVFEAADMIRSLSRREEARRHDPLPLSELSALVESKLKPLSDLYSKTRQDWVLEVSHILTEPTCPTATIRPEGSNSLRYSVHRDTVVEAIVAAADIACREMIHGVPIQSESPVTNPDDRVHGDGGSGSNV